MNKYLFTREGYGCEVFCENDHDAKNIALVIGARLEGKVVESAISIDVEKIRKFINKYHTSEGFSFRLSKGIDEQLEAFITEYLEIGMNVEEVK